MKNKLFFFLAFSFLLITQAFPCTCIEEKIALEKKIQKAYNQVDAIIQAEVIDIVKIEHRNQPESFLVSVQIQKIHKGKLNMEILKIATPTDGATCGYKFEKGKSYLIYAWKASEENADDRIDFWTGLCDRNEELENVDKKELKILSRLHAN